MAWLKRNGLSPFLFYSRSHKCLKPFYNLGGVELMLRSNIQMGEFIAQLKKILYSVVVKRNKLAAAFDTDLAQKKAADKYINTIDNGDDWNSYVIFDRDVLRSAGIDENLITIYQSDKEKIPRELRKKVVSLQKQYIIDNYVETNDYYLMLHGEPSIEDAKLHEEYMQHKDDPGYNGKDPFIYCPDNDYGIPTKASGIPVHKLDITYVNLMDSLNITSTLIADNPTKPYLKYIGSRSIDYYTARTADNFAILYTDIAGIDSTIREDFLIMYDKARAYYMIGFYNREYSNMFAWYDEFIGLCIITMAIQRLIANIYHQGLTRDFYDTNLIKYLFKSYSIPYIEELDIKYQRALAKNLNYLLQYKSTDKVLYDVAYLLGFYDINIYKYYLIKYHKLNDTTGLPEFPKIREKIDGEIVEHYDYPKMYGFYFQQINLKETDVNAALADQRFKYSFADITEDDPYWITDSDLMTKLYETDFNHLITKYMSMDVVVKVVEMMYEVAHTVRMIIDNRKDFEKISVNIPYISQYDINLFDLIIFLSALASKLINLPGRIPLKGYQIANVYGFNYTENIDALKAAIYDTKDLQYDEILYAEDTGIFYLVKPGDVVTVPNMVRNVNSDAGTDETTTIEKYNFHPLDVIVVESFDDVDPVPGKYYKASDDITNTVIYQYTATEGYQAKDVTPVATLAYNLIDQNLASYIEAMRAVEPGDVGKIYDKLKTLRLFITKMLTDTKDKDVYYQYRKLYRALLVTEDAKELYELGDGDVSTTFEIYLSKINPNLYDIYKSAITNENLLNNTINLIFSKLASLGNYKYLANIGRVDRLFDTVMKLIRFFKSYTVDFVNSGVHYVLDDRYLQGLKIMDEFRFHQTGFSMSDYMTRCGMWYKDFIEGHNSVLRLYEDFHLNDVVAWNTTILLWDRYILKLHDSYISSNATIPHDDLIDLYDNMYMHANIDFISSKYKLSDYLWMTSWIIPPQMYEKKFRLRDSLYPHIDMQMGDDRSESIYSIDLAMPNVRCDNPMKSDLKLRDRLFITVNKT